jgi:hypothetical protein
MGRFASVWACRDSLGVIHTARVERNFGVAGILLSVAACTACVPRILSRPAPEGRWHGVTLPPFRVLGHNNADLFTLVAYNVHESPTCVSCVSMSMALGALGL